MDMKRTQIARQGQSSFDRDVKFNKDASNKQFSRQRSGQPESINSNKKKNKSRNNNFYDKRPQAKKSGLDQIENDASESARLNDSYELNSVSNHGSKKQNLNHLLNFHYYNAAESGVVRAGAFSKHGYHQHRSFKKHSFNKEQYLQANCQFVVKADNNYDYQKSLSSPDALVEWDRIEKVLVSSSEESQCPICLYSPVAARITRCGHLFCFPCILHYLSLESKPYGKCPICFDNVYLKDLRSAKSKLQSSYKLGDVITFELMKREKDVFFNVTRADEIQPWLGFPNLSDEDDARLGSKIILAQPEDIIKIIDHELVELEFQLIEDGENCTESVFIQQAMELLKAKRKDLDNLIGTKDRHEEKLNSLAEEDECRSPIPSEETISSNYYYYQAQNAQNIFMHSINKKMLIQTYGELEKAPQQVQGTVVQIETCSMDADLRRRLKHLQHLPLSTVFEIVELELDASVVPDEVFSMFKDELSHRRKARQRREREEKKREKEIEKINDKQMGKLIKSTANINIDSTLQFPECGSFPQMPSTSSAPDGTPSFSKMLTAASKAAKSANLWPSLSSSDASTSASYFGETSKLSIARKSAVEVKQEPLLSDEDDVSAEAETDCSAPAYNNQLGDCLANALAKSVSLKGVKLSKSKKKNKKTLLFASGFALQPEK